MNDTFLQYFESHSLTRTLIDRIDNIYNIYIRLGCDEITNIFISDFIKEDGTRDYESLWFFSKNYLMEAKEFTTKYDIDMVIFPSKIRYLKFEFSDYDFNKANDNSRLLIYFSFEPEMSCTLKASKGNCDYLLHNIFEVLVKPILGSNNS